ncbi:MAG TPA: hypothetical protein VG963_33310, partial [Polyangiaceae bacterium]|nr:hypothetical protein [Polyangiaceae bacterium]
DADLDSGTTATDAGHDAGSPANDAGNTGDDAAADTGSPSPVDSGSAIPADSGQPSADSGATAPADSGQPQIDSGSPGADSGATVVDAGTGACQACQNANCRDYMGIDLVHGCFEAVDPEYGADGSDPDFIQQCTDVVACAHEKQCGYGDGGEASDCYCGSANVDTCAANGPAADAPCSQQWQKATRTIVNAEVQVRFTDLSYPAGWAYFLIECERVSCVPSGACAQPSR